MGVRCITARGTLNVTSVSLASESHSALRGTAESLAVPIESM